MMPTSNGTFASAVIETQELVRLLAATSDGTVRAGIMRVAAGLGTRPAGAFESLDACARTNGPPFPDRLAVGTVTLMRDLFLERADQALQTLYRAHLAQVGDLSQRNHRERLACLQSVRAEACDIVNAHDWVWLADWLGLSRLGESSATCVARLSNLAFRCDQVNFRFTYHCNIACRHCYNNSGPEAKAEHLDLDQMLQVIAEMPGAGVRALNLTGGEPFLYLEELERLVRAARDADIETITIYTNAFWATSEPHADRVLARLHAAGFMTRPGDHLKVSGGVYHQEFIPADRLGTVARVYRRAFQKNLLLDLELATDDVDSRRAMTALITEAGLRDHTSLHFRRVKPLGRASALEPTEFLTDIEACHTIDQLTFDPDGAVRPCCGFNNANSGIIVGRIGHGSLRELIKAMQNDPILQFLAAHPMQDIFPYVGKVPASDGYGGKCHLCQDALGDLDNREEVQARLFPQQRF